MKEKTHIIIHCIMGALICIFTTLYFNKSSEYNNLNDQYHILANTNNGNYYNQSNTSPFISDYFITVNDKNNSVLSLNLDSMYKPDNVTLFYKEHNSNNSKYSKKEMELSDYETYIAVLPSKDKTYNCYIDVKMNDKTYTINMDDNISYNNYLLSKINVDLSQLFSFTSSVSTGNVSYSIYINNDNSSHKYAIKSLKYVLSYNGEILKELNLKDLEKGSLDNPNSNHIYKFMDNLSFDLNDSSARDDLLEAKVTFEDSLGNKFEKTSSTDLKIIK
ncbi:MAG: hypothetical protein ACRCVJ_02330 [Clostridium sp.]|uniref:hypothetical protein n=1 Tax=Clostridium sp. TaxID=1506 RepID=UPI003F3598C3